MPDFLAAKKFTNCFVCSPTNPHGLHLKNKFVNGRAHMEFLPHRDMEGLMGLMHGGFSLMLMDEVMHYAVESLKIDIVTLNMNCDFVSPANLNHLLIAEGWIDERDGKKITACGELRDSVTGKVVVTAKGLYYQVDMKKFLPKSIRLNKTNE